MPTFSRPSADADEARDALRGLAHATLSIDNPTEIYDVLGSLAAGLAALQQTLHQLGRFHDRSARKRTSTDGDARTGTAPSHQVAWELHRAAEIVRQAAACLDRTHEVEATIVYDVPDFPTAPDGRPSAPEPGLSL